MVKGIGIDLTRISRFDINNKKLVERILSEKELEVFQNLNNDNKPAYLASRFALKEAYYKASQDNCSFSSISFLNDKNGKPYMDERDDVLVSVSDEDDYLTTIVIIN